MLKILLSAAALAAVAFAASSAYARGGGGGGPVSPEASPYAILEPQTVNPELAAPSAAFTAAYGVAQPRYDVTHTHRGRRSHRHAE